MHYEPFVCMECEEPRPLYRDGVCKACWRAMENEPVNVGDDLHQVLADALRRVSGE